jgi:hypothetical protein
VAFQMSVMNTLAWTKRAIMEKRAIMDKRTSLPRNSKMTITEQN